MNKETSELVTRARLFATAAHAAVGQRRKYTDEPYIVHPAEVAGIVASVDGDELVATFAGLGTKKLSLTFAPIEKAE